MEKERDRFHLAFEIQAQAFAFYQNKEDFFDKVNGKNVIRPTTTTFEFHRAEKIYAENKNRYGGRSLVYASWVDSKYEDIMFFGRRQKTVHRPETTFLYQETQFGKNRFCVAVLDIAQDYGNPVTHHIYPRAKRNREGIVELGVPSVFRKATLEDIERWSHVTAKIRIATDRRILARNEISKKTSV